MDPWFVRINLLEAALWWVVAVVVVARWRLWGVAAALVLFGLSDVVETRTGAWWRPWWLLAWKGACVLIVAVILWRRWRGAT